jgi:hypothetical protein
MRPVATAVRTVLLLLLLVTSLEVAGPGHAAPAPRTAAVGQHDATAARVARCVPRCYGAISVNPANGKWGASIDKFTRHRAVAVAQSACKAHSGSYRSHCKRMIWFRNACAAVAYRVHNGQLAEYDAAYARYKSGAKAKALRKVRGPGHRYIWTWACTSRRFGRVTAASERSLTP